MGGVEKDERTKMNERTNERTYMYHTIHTCERQNRKANLLYPNILRMSVNKRYIKEMYNCAYQ